MRPTKAFENVSATERFQHLDGAHVHDMADAARAAALAFVSCSRYGWGRKELAAWLVEHYRVAAIPAPAGRATWRRPAVDTALDRAVDDTDVAALVARARRHASDLVSTAWSTWRTQGFAREMLDSGFVVGVTDADGGLGYAAVHREGMRLVDRVVSLFLADFLTRPNDYESLLVCEDCSEVSFAGEEVHEEGCSARGPVSGIIVRKPNFTRLGLGNR